MPDVSTLMALADAFADEESLRVRAQLRAALQDAIRQAFANQREAHAALVEKMTFDIRRARTFSSSTYRLGVPACEIAAAIRSLK